jgi:hypothetical protein
MEILSRVGRKSWSETFEIFEPATSGYFGLVTTLYVLAIQQERLVRRYV